MANLTSRLRNYGCLRRHLGSASVHLLQFFVNHRRCRRREPPQRVDPSPAEWRPGPGPAPWLALLGLPDPLANGLAKHRPGPADGPADLAIGARSLTARIVTQKRPTLNQA